MMVSTRRARQMLTLPLMLAGVIGWLFLPGKARAASIPSGKPRWSSSTRKCGRALPPPKRRPTYFEGLRPVLRFPSLKQTS